MAVRPLAEAVAHVGGRSSGRWLAPRSTASRGWPRPALRNLLFRRPATATGRPLAATRAAAVLVPSARRTSVRTLSLVAVPSPHLAYGAASALFHPVERPPPGGSSQGQRPPDGPHSPRGLRPGLRHGGGRGRGGRRRRPHRRHARAGRASAGLPAPPVTVAERCVLGSASSCTRRPWWGRMVPSNDESRINIAKKKKKPWPWPWPWPNIAADMPTGIARIFNTLMGCGCAPTTAARRCTSPGARRQAAHGVRRTVCTGASATWTT